MFLSQLNDQYDFDFSQKTNMYVHHLQMMKSGKIGIIFFIINGDRNDFHH